MTLRSLASTGGSQDGAGARRESLSRSQPAGSGGVFGDVSRSFSSHFFLSKRQLSDEFEETLTMKQIALAAFVAAVCLLATSRAEDAEAAPCYINVGLP